MNDNQAITPYVAFILAAGLGTRLKTYTATMPKALVPVNGKPLLERLILKMKQQPIRRIVINVHHFADQIVDFLNAHQNFGIDIVLSDERAELLDTGGALVHAKSLLTDSPFFLVHNVDIVSNLQFSSLINLFLESNALAMLAVRDRPTNRKFLFDDKLSLQGWQNSATDETILLSKPALLLTELAFSGIHVLRNTVFDNIHQTGKFSIIKTYLELAKEHAIYGYRHDDDYWFDCGTPEQ